MKYETSLWKSGKDPQKADKQILVIFLGGYMKNILFCVALALLVIGIVSLHFRYTRGGDRNWELVNLPFPGAGLVVGGIFNIENGGEFDLDISVPMLGEISASMPPSPPPIKCRLKVTVVGINGIDFENTQYIEEFRSYGGGGFSRTIFYNGAKIELKQKGGYSIEIVNEDRDGIFENCSKTGGMIQLVRYYTKPTETYLRYLLWHVMSYALIIISIIGMVIFGILANFKK